MVATAAFSSACGGTVSGYTEMEEMKTYCCTLGASSSADIFTMRGT
jgi:hypothetical protein